MTLELGTTSLTQARLARGLTLEDAERGTRISRRFLIALEEHNYSVFPAPIYARGFLRTYCRFLGVEAEPHLAELPEGWAASPPATPLPPVSHGPLTVNMAWVLAGVVLVAIVGLGLFFSRGGQSLGELEAQSQVETQNQQPSLTGASREPQQQQQAGPVSTETASTAGRPLDAGIPGLLPDFTSVAVDDVTGFLEEQGIAYLQIDTVSTSALEGLILAQDPAPGTNTNGLQQVTLTVSAGASPDLTTRTDCGVLGATNQRTLEEQVYYENNCGTTAPVIADRTNCEEIRGTDYRSPAERTFFLANCIIQ